VDAPGAPPAGPGLLDDQGAGSGAPGPTGRSWRSIEEVLAVHSAELTESAAVLARSVEERPDSCRQGHPRTEGRCPDCAKGGRQRRAEGRCARGHDLTPGNVIVVEVGGHRERRCRRCKQLAQQAYSARRRAARSGP
jgi:hypothetical protein